MFRDDEVTFDIIPNCFFKITEEKLSELAFVPDSNLPNNIALSAIVGEEITKNQIFAQVEKLYGVQVCNLYDVRAFVDSERYERLNAMIDSRFTDENIIALMSAFEERRDSEIQAMVLINKKQVAFQRPALYILLIFKWNRNKPKFLWLPLLSVR